MIHWQVLSNWSPLIVHKKQAMAVLVDLHIIAGAYPGAMFRFRFLVGVETARTERLAEYCKIFR